MPTELDPIYFKEAPWSERLDNWLRERSPEYDRFYLANEAHISESILSGEAALRMVVNIPADALLSFLRQGRYENTYERKGLVVGNDMGAIHPRRRRVDEALFGDDADRYYYGAVALGGCGIRFYGEYCMVLRPDAVADETRIMDRNSWDIDLAPLSDYDAGTVVARLKGQWSTDLVDMALLKVLPQLAEPLRLTTTGNVADAVLHDESFIEVHRRGTFTPADLYEVRESVAGATIEADLERRSDRGETLTLEEGVWMRRRRAARDALRATGIRLRVVETSGRVR